MVYRGRVKNGVVVLEAGVSLWEGMAVRVEPVENPAEMQRLREGLLSFSGVVKDGPSDLARNHGHYLYGVPRQ